MGDICCFRFYFATFHYSEQQTLGCYSYSTLYHFHKQYIATCKVEAAFYVAIDNAKISRSANSAPLPALYGIPQPLKSYLTIPTVYPAPQPPPTKAQPRI